MDCFKGCGIVFRMKKSFAETPVQKNTFVHISEVMKKKHLPTKGGKARARKMVEAVIRPKKTKGDLIVRSPAQKVKKLDRLKRELFCQLYVKNRALFGNATQCYAEAYDYKLHTLSRVRPVTKSRMVKETDEETGEVVEREVAMEHGDSKYEKALQVCASAGERLLRNVEVNNRVTELLLEVNTEDEADAELSWLMKQREELTPKLGAIREFNAVRGRVKQKVDHTHKFIGLVKHIYDEADKLK